MPLDTINKLAHPTLPNPAPLDGVSQWQVFSTGAESARTEALLNLAPTQCNSEVCDIPGIGAYRSGKWKLIHGHTVVWGYKSTENGCLTCATHGGQCPNPKTFPLECTDKQTTPNWCTTGWVLPAGHGDPQPPPEAPCSGKVPCNVTGPLINGGTFLYDVVSDPFERHDVAAENPDIVSQLLAKLQAINATNIPQNNSGLDPRSNPKNFGGVWTPWRGDPVPQHCSINTTEYGAELVSNVDPFALPTGEKAPVLVRGWLWNKAQADGGIAALNASITADGKQVGFMLAALTRPQLHNITGAPNNQHGFQFSFGASGDYRTGSHVFHVYGWLGPSNDIPVELTNSPVCFTDGSRKPCPGKTRDEQIAEVRAMLRPYFPPEELSMLSEEDIRRQQSAMA